MFERMNIPRKEAIKIHGSHYERKEYKVGQLLEEYYDLDTIVEVYNKEGELLIKENALNILVLNYLSDCEILDYYDNCYADQSISITPKGVIIPVLYDEIYERLCIKS
ncbi:hypothetical protein [Butyrivibrio fibrisolvens]|nr:hypothetical protein [Butyrivibrio fibrisolvens]